MKLFNRYPFNLRVKLAVALLTVLVPILMFEIRMVGREYERETGTIFDEHQQVAEVVGSLVDTTFADALSVAQALAVDPVIQRRNPTETARQLRVMQMLFPQYMKLAVADARGEVVASSIENSDVSSLNVADRDFFRQMLATDRPVLSNVILGRLESEPLVVALAPIHDDAGGIAGAVLVAVSMEQLRDGLVTTPMIDGQVVGLADPTGRLGFHTEQSDLAWEQRDLTLWMPLVDALHGETVQVSATQSPLGDGERVATFIRTERFGWVVFVSMPTEAAFGPIAHLFYLRLAVLAGVCFMSVGLAIFLGHFITRPLATLVAGVKAIAQGDLRTRVKVQTGDEFATVATAFNDMAAQLEARAQEKEELDRQRETFISVVAHDLRSPLTIIGGYASWLSGSDAAAQLSTQHRQALQAISANTQRLTRMVNDLLDVSRLEARQLGLDCEPVDLSEVVGATVEELRHSIVHHPICLTCSPHPAVVNGDPGRLRQVLINLLTNAAKYSPPESPIDVVVDVGDDSVLVRIIDRGQGIAPDAQLHVFDRFFRGGQPKGTRAEGLGLGLYIARGLIEAHGGTISVESQVGHGTAFTLTLPLSKPAEREVVPPTPVRATDETG